MLHNSFTDHMRLCLFLGIIVLNLSYSQIQTAIKLRCGTSCKMTLTSKTHKINEDISHSSVVLRILILGLFSTTYLTTFSSSLL
jgi:hypothetical protein